MRTTTTIANGSPEKEREYKKLAVKELAVMMHDRKNAGNGSWKKAKVENTAKSMKTGSVAYGY